MFKKHFSKTIFLATTVLAAPLNAAQYLAQDESKNDSEETSSSQKPYFTASTTPKENDSSVNPTSLEEEKKNLEKELKIKKQKYGTDHLATGHTMSNLGYVLSNLGEYSSSKRYYEQALKIFKKNYEADHLETATTMYNLGSVLEELGAYESAEKYLKNALAIQEQNSVVGNPLQLIRVLESDLKRDIRGILTYEAAEKFRQKLEAIEEKNERAMDIQKAATMSSLGSVLIKLGKYALAKNYLEQALATQAQYCGVGYFKTAITRENLFRVLYNLGQYQEARACYRSRSITSLHTMAKTTRKQRQQKTV